MSLIKAEKWQLSLSFYKKPQLHVVAKDFNLGKDKAVADA
jgi:hypothetical protein